MCTYHAATWDEPSCYNECEDFKEADYKLCEIENALKRVVKMIYGYEDIDICKLDDALGEMCDAVGISVPETQPRITRKNELFELAKKICQ
jgi:hypothetical protein